MQSPTKSPPLPSTLPPPGEHAVVEFKYGMLHTPSRAKRRKYNPLVQRCFTLGNHKWINSQCDPRRLGGLNRPAGPPPPLPGGPNRSHRIPQWSHKHQMIRSTQKKNNKTPKPSRHQPRRRIAPAGWGRSLTLGKRTAPFSLPQPEMKIKPGYFNSIL